MKILVITSFATHPPYAGNSACILSYTNVLKSQGHEVFLLWIIPHSMASSEIDMMKNNWCDNLLIYRKLKFQYYNDLIFRNLRFKPFGYYSVDDLYPIGLNRFLKKVIRKNSFDCAIVNYIFLTKSFKVLKKIIKHLYTHDVFTNRYQNTGNSWFSTTANQEAKALNRADVIWALQENEADYFKSLTKKTVITTYCHFPIHQTAYNGNKTLLFLSGSNSHNIEAITYFINTIFDEIVQEIPDIKLLIGGTICKSISSFIKHKNIELYGEVEDMVAFYSQGDIFINPTFNGTGLKIKTFEAMSYGKIMICHKHNTLGIYKKETAPILVVNKETDYVDFLKQLFANKEEVINLKQQSVNYINEVNELVALRIAVLFNNKALI